MPVITTSWYREVRRLGVVGLLLLSAAATLSCDLVGGGSSAPSDPKELILEEAQSVVAVNYPALFEADDLPSFLLRGDEDAVDFQDRLEDSWDDAAHAFATDIDDVEAVYAVEVRGTAYTVVKGDFDFIDIQNELEDMDFEEDTYRDLQLWSGRFGRGVALFEETGIYVYGLEDTVKDVLKAIDRGEGFMDSEAGLRRALAAAGIVLFTISAADCDKYVGSGGILDAEVDFGDFRLEGCEGIAYGVIEGDEDETKLVLAAEFRSERRAESGMEDLEDYIDDQDLDADVDDVRIDGTSGILKLTAFE